MRRTAFLKDLMPIEKTIITYSDNSCPNKEELFRTWYLTLLKYLGDLAEKASPCKWDMPENNYEYIFEEITYKFYEVRDLFVNVDDIDDYKLPCYRHNIHTDQATLLIQLSSMLEEYEETNLKAIREVIGKKVFNMINAYFHPKNPKSVFPYSGINKIISLDPEWDKIRNIANLTWKKFIFEGVKE